MPTRKVLSLRREEDLLLLDYEPSRGTGWIPGALDSGGFTVRGVFTLKREDLMDPALTDDELVSGEDDVVTFVLGEKIDDYYRLKPSVTSTEHAFFMHETLPLTEKLFNAGRRVSVLHEIDRMVCGDVYLGGDREGAVPSDAVTGLIESFPTEWELGRYVAGRVASAAREYLDMPTDAEAAYNRYMTKKAAKGSTRTLPSDIRANDLEKYRLLLASLEEMLADEFAYSEHEWQQKILQTILLLYPKYIRVLSKVPVKDVYAEKMRQLDLLLVDASGHVDLIEIKQPFERCIMSKTLYRDNHVPLRELAGAVMQVEKYIFYLNKWGRAGEEALSRRYAGELPSGLEIAIVNPQGFIIMGRDATLTDAERKDFEVVRRKYRNVVDIITYDDLVRRLHVMIEALAGPA